MDSILPNRQLATAIWISPCVSRHSRGEGLRMPRYNRAEVQQYLDAILPSADACYQRGGFVAVEIPPQAPYLEMPCVKKFVARFGLRACKFDSCCFGQCAENGVPVKQPRRLLTNLPSLRVPSRWYVLWGWSSPSCGGRRGSGATRFRGVSAQVCSHRSAALS